LFLNNLKENFDVGNSRKRKRNPKYTALLKTGKQSLVSPFLANDDSYKRVRMVRYADDCLISVIGSKSDCTRIKDEISQFLSSELKLTLNTNKSLITHATTDSAYFLGHYITITPDKKKPIRKVSRSGKRFMMKINTKPQLIAPIDKILAKLKVKGLAKEDNLTKTIKGTCYNLYTRYDDATIIKYLRGLWHGIRNYYSMANNYSSLHSIRYVI
jgi:hypothetical protein